MSPWRAGYEMGLEDAIRERNGDRFRECKRCGTNTWHREGRCTAIACHEFRKARHAEKKARKSA